MTLTTRPISGLDNTLTSLQNGDWFVVDRAGTPQKITRQNVYSDFATSLAVNDGLQFIATADASASAALDFTLDATKYDGYVIVFGNLTPSTDAGALLLRTSTDGGSNFDAGASDYDYAYLRRTTLGLDVSDQSSGATGIVISPSVGNDTEEDGVSGKIVISHPHLAKRTNVIFENFGRNSAGPGEFLSGGGSRASSADVDAVRLLFGNGNIASGSATIYGYRNA